jgi:hypothetical protein
MCRRPCWPSPEEALKLIEAGYGDRLMLDWWVGDGENIYILAPAIKGLEGKDAPSWPDGMCTFQRDEDSLCELHNKNLKPIEGRLARCKGGRNGRALHYAVAQLWDNDEARELIGNWKARRQIKMEITKKDFEAYEEVRSSGVTNMFAVTTVSQLSGLSKDKILEIMKTYEGLMKKYPGVRD